MELREYQKKCIDTIEAQDSGAYLVQMATGLGKTVTFANLPRHGERMLILSHREELVEAMEGTADQYAKERTLEHADQLYQAVYGVPVPAGNREKECDH